MNIKSKIIKAMTLLLQGKPNKIYANVSYLQPRGQLVGKKTLNSN